MIVLLNKHGPGNDPMLGTRSNRGSPPSTPVSRSCFMAVKPPGLTIRSVVITCPKVTDRLRLLTTHKWPRYDIAPGLPVLSHSGQPPNLLLQTHLPVGSIHGETQEISCMRRILPGFEHSALSTQHSVNSLEFGVWSYQLKRIKNVSM